MAFAVVIPFVFAVVLLTFPKMSAASYAILLACWRLAQVYSPGSRSISFVW